MRRKLKSFLSSLVAALLLATLIVPLAACDNNTTVSVVSMGNKGLAGVTVTAQSGNNKKSGTTNSSGHVSLDLDKSLNYTVTFEDLPKGYYTDPSVSYTIKANSSSAKFYMPSKVIKDESVESTYVYKTGDVMYDFSFKPSGSGDEVSLSTELETKKAVLINFWGSLCSNCQSEFPAIESTYKMFQDKLSVLALDPPGAYGDTDAKILSTLAQWAQGWTSPLTFYYGLDSANIFKNFYAPAQSGDFVLPISVIIDRYGVVCEIEVGSENDASKWQGKIAKYVADDYVPDIKFDQSSTDVENFVPDKPADFHVKMSDPADIDRAINKTGTDILFYEDGGEYSWPWALSSDGKSIVPLGSGHGRSYSIIYADINIAANKALLVDYKISSQEDYDLFEIVVDGNDLGRVTFTDSGNKDWATALAFIPLTPGNHQIAFVYYKGTIDGKYEDTVYLNNLRLVDATSDKVPSADISYYAARDFDADLNTYNTYEDVYYDDPKDGGDGYYHVSGYENITDKDPYLLLDITHITPFARGASLYEQFISENNTTFGNKNYYNELMTYAYVAGNSKVEGAVPVTQQLHDILVALCRHEAGSAAYNANPNIWLEFCTFYLHFGEGEPMDDPAKGYAYFSAYEAKETEVYDTELSQQRVNNINSWYTELAGNPTAERRAELQALIDQTTKAYEDNLATYNSVEFDNIIIPRGKVVKFTANEDGVYHFYSVGREDNPEYICEAELYDESLNLHTALVAPVASHDSDTLFRDGSPSQFHLYHYLKAGESCYLNLMFYSTETIDTMYYAINKLDEPVYRNLKTVTAGFYTSSLNPDTLGQIYRPLHIEGLELRGDYYYETKFDGNILVDFTGITRFSTSHTLEQVINAAATDNPLQSGGVDVNFDLTGIEVRLGKVGDPNYEVIVGRDYSETMDAYLDQAKANDGLVNANKELRDILLLFISKYDEIVVEEDWLAFCYFYEYFGANY